MTAGTRLGDFTTQWRRSPYVIAMNDGQMAKVDGMVLGDGQIGIHVGVTHFVDVTHTVSGFKLAGFQTLGAAVEYAERIAHFRDWMIMPVVLTPEEKAALMALRDTIALTEHFPHKVVL
jgi:hypothetical protein